MNVEQLRRFLLEANASGYAAGGAARETKEADGSTTIVHDSGDWKMHDNFFGGEPYGGREVIFYKGRPVWMMVYYGWVEPSVSNMGAVYGFLRNALKQMPESSPFRGPQHYTEGDSSYNNTWQGDIERFSGEEIILENGKQIYTARYMGGFVDQRAG